MHMHSAASLRAAFRNSLRSSTGNPCVEVATDLVGATWHTSTRSQNSNQCVEVADLVRQHGFVAVRDSKDPAGPAVTVHPAAWQAFVTSGLLPGA
jgi:hypothetical protein